MNHIVTISIAPVITVLDDNADLLNITAVPFTLAFWLPCWLYHWVIQFQPRYFITRAYLSLSDYLRGWRDDLRLMREALRWQCGPVWVYG